jgi:mRNA interferase MazF
MGVAVAGPAVSRGQVYVVRFDPTLGSAIKKYRPCVILSPDEVNEHPPDGSRGARDDRRACVPMAAPRRRFQGRAGSLRTINFALSIWSAS